LAKNRVSDTGRFLPLRNPVGKKPGFWLAKNRVSDTGRFLETRLAKNRVSGWQKTGFLVGKKPGF
jgi:hypothetical protein